MSNKRKHPLNAEGKFWIDQDSCLACAVCYDDEFAPQNIEYDDKTGMSYVFKQPETEEEFKAVRKAIDYCCVEAIIED
jgi:ferredoxin